MDKFRDFCHSYGGVEPENLSGKNVKAKIFTLVVHQEQAGRLNNLKSAAQRLAKREKAKTDDRQRESLRRRNATASQPATLTPAGVLLPPQKYLARNDWWFWFQLALLSVIDPKRFREETFQQNVGSDRRLARAGFTFISVLLFLQILFSLIEIYPNLENPKWAIKNEYLQFSYNFIPGVTLCLMIFSIILIMLMIAANLDLEKWGGWIILALVIPVTAFTSQIGYEFGTFYFVPLFTELVITIVICFNIATSVKLIYPQYSIKNISKIKITSLLILLTSLVLAVGIFLAGMSNVGWSEGDSINFLGILLNIIIGLILFVATISSLLFSIQQSLKRNRLGTQSLIIILGVCSWLAAHAFCVFYLTV